jgi:hypothetical protein
MLLDFGGGDHLPKCALSDKGTPKPFTAWKLTWFLARSAKLSDNRNADEHRVSLILPRPCNQ